MACGVPVVSTTGGALPEVVGDAGITVAHESDIAITSGNSLTVAATHGSPWRYDTYVPIMFAGAGLKPQRVHRKVQTVDVATTLAALVGAKPPSGASGEILSEILE